jgi:hypothetical protein
MRFTKNAVLSAIKGSGGIVSNVANRLNCSWVSARKYIDVWPETKQAYEEEKEAILDLCESVLYSSIKNGDTQSAKWVLATKGKERGFIERREVTGENGAPLVVKVELIGDEDTEGV